MPISGSTEIFLGKLNGLGSSFLKGYMLTRDSLCVANGKNETFSELLCHPLFPCSFYCAYLIARIMVSLSTCGFRNLWHLFVYSWSYSFTV